MGMRLPILDIAALAQRAKTFYLKWIWTRQYKMYKESSR